MSIHHVTAIAGDPQRNLDFYAGALGLRLVKLTVNFDDPGTYHLYFGDELGRPGSILTFFPWPDGARGRQGTGQVGTVSLAIPPASLGYWIERLLQHGIKYEGPTRRFDEQVLAFADPDGLLLELVATPRVERVEPWRGRTGAGGARGARHSWRSRSGRTATAGTAEFLTGFMGFRPVAEEGNRIRFESAPRRCGQRRGSATRGQDSGPAGPAWAPSITWRSGRRRTTAQLAQRTRLEAAGVELTPVVDRQYFRSVVFPGAGRRPVRDRDRPAGVHARRAGGSRWARSLRLPPRYEPMRERIEAHPAAAPAAA